MKKRPLIWASAKTCAAIDECLALRLAKRQAITTNRAAYRGLDQNSHLFLAGDGEPFTFTPRRHARARSATRVKR